MKSSIQTFLALCVFVAWSSMAAESTTIDGRVQAFESLSQDVWVGIYASPLKQGDEAWKWTTVDSEKFSLEVPNVTEVLLVALCRDYLPIIQEVALGNGKKSIDLEFQKGLHVEGTILSTDGIPVADLVLTLERPDLPRVSIPDKARSSWTTNEDGQFKISGLSEDTYELRFELPHALDESFSIRVSERDDRPHELTLSNAYFVLGRVVDQQDIVVQDADITVHVYSDETQIAKSEKSGEFQLGPFIQGRKLRVAATHEELGLSEHSRVTAGDHDVKLVLAPMVRVLGKVIDASSGEPVDDFELRTFGNGWYRPYQHVDSDGFISAMVDSRTWALVIHSPDYVPHFSVGLTLEPNSEHDMDVVSLDLGKTLTGTVYDAATQQPINEARLSLASRNNVERMSDTYDYDDQEFVRDYISSTLEAETDQNGEYSLGPLPFAPIEVRVWAWDYHDQSQTVDSLATVLDIPLKREEERVSPTRILGEIKTASGEAIGGLVTIRNVDGGGGKGFSVSDDGKFDEPTDAGTYEVFAKTNSGMTDRVTVDLPENETREVQLIVDSKGRLQVTIEGLRDGETATVTLHSQEDTALSVLGPRHRLVYQVNSLRSKYGLKNGSFVLEGVGYGEFRVEAQTSMNRRLKKSFELSPHQIEAYAELIFRGSSRVYGSLTFPDGSVPSGEVHVVPKQSELTSAWTEIGADGTFEIEGLDDGEYTMWTVEIEEKSFSFEGRRNTSTSTSTGKQVDVVVNGDTEQNIQLSQSGESD